MTTPLTTDALAALLTDAAGRIVQTVAAQYQAPASRSYLQPVLGPLAAGPRVVGELSGYLARLTDAPLPTTPAGLFALASYASALGWLTESLAALTADVERISTRAGTLALAEDPDMEKALHGTGALEALRGLAINADLPLGEYVAAVAESMLALESFTEACAEIADSLAKDAALVRESTGQVHFGDGPDSLPTLVRTLLAAMESDQ